MSCKVLYPPPPPLSPSIPASGRQRAKDAFVEKNAANGDPEKKNISLCFSSSL